MAAKKRGFCIGCAAVGLVVMGGAVWLGLRGLKPKPPEVRTFAVEKGDITVDVTESGTVEAVKWVDVRPRAGGRLAALIVDEGQVVHPGEVLARIDPMETELNAKAARAQVVSARSRQAQSVYQYQQDDASAQSEVRQAESRLAQVKSELEIQPGLTKNSIEQAAAALESAKEDLNLLRTSTIPLAISEADARLKQAQANALEAEANFDRMKRLLTKDFVAKRDFDAAKAQYDATQALLESARRSRELLDLEHPARLRVANQRVREQQAGLDTALKNGIRDKTKRDEYETALAQLSSAKARLRGVRASRESVNQAKAGVDQVSSQAADAERRLRETEIRSPMLGVAVKKYLQQGDTVTAQSDFSQGTAVYQIADLSALRIRLLVNEVDIPKVKLDQKVEVTLDAVPGASFTGKVHRIGAASQSTQSTGQANLGSQEAVVKFEVEVRLSGTDLRLKPGMSAKCRIIASSAIGVPVLSVEAVGKRGSDKYYGVKVIGTKKQRDGTMKNETKEVPLEVGLRTPTKYEIKSGAGIGDKFLQAPYEGPKRKDMNFGPDGE